MDHVVSINDSLEFIDKNLSENISLEALAEKAYLSKYHYHRLFHKTIGETVNKYISKKRMVSAAKELIQTDQPIIDISLKYQYGSQEAFTRAFKRTYAMTPGKYRKTYTCSKVNNIIYLRSYHNKITDIAA